MQPIEISRRRFIRGLFVAPAIIAVDRLMPVKLVPEAEAFLGNHYLTIQTLTPVIVGDGVHDDGPGIQAFLQGLDFVDRAGGFRTEIRDGAIYKRFGNGVFFTPKTLVCPPAKEPYTLIPASATYKRVNFS